MGAVHECGQQNILVQDVDSARAVASVKGGPKEEVSCRFDTISFRYKSKSFPYRSKSFPYKSKSFRYESKSFRYKSKSVRYKSKSFQLKSKSSRYKSNWSHFDIRPQSGLEPIRYKTHFTGYKSHKMLRAIILIQTSLSFIQANWSVIQAILARLKQARLV